MPNNPKPLDPRSQLIEAMNGGLMFLETICAMAAAHPELYDAKSNEGWTPLHFATQPDLAKLLIGKGACVDAKTNDGMTPLHLAAIDGSKDVAELLLANNAEVDARTNDGKTPLHLAAKEGKKDLIELLLGHGAKVNARTNSGWTPLHWAAWQGLREVAELLLAKHADVFVENNKGETPLSKAIEWNNTDIATLLRAHGAKTEAGRRIACSHNSTTITTLEDLFSNTNVLFSKAIASRLNIPRSEYNESTEKQQMVERFFFGITSISRHNEDNDEIFNEIYLIHYKEQELDPSLVAFIKQQIQFSRRKFSHEITTFSKLVKMIHQDVEPATIWATVEPMVSIGEEYKTAS